MRICLKIEETDREGYLFIMEVLIPELFFSTILVASEKYFQNVLELKYNK